jgi:hypothetical protein
VDNGMSLAMAPEISFISLVKSLYKDYGIKCEPMQPVWGCDCTKQQYDKLPSISFNIF